MVEEFTVRSVSSLDHQSGFHALTDRGTVPLRSLLRLVEQFDATYAQLEIRGFRTVALKTGFGPLDHAKRHTSFRWSWESYRSGCSGEMLRYTDTLFVTAHWAR